VTKALLEDMASKNYHWSSKRPLRRQAVASVVLI